MADAKPIGPLEDPREERFCREYLVDFNGAGAVARAGYTQKPRSAAVQAARLLTRANIRERLAELAQQQVKRLKLEEKADDTIEELTWIGKSDLRRIMDDKGSFLPMKEWPKSIARAISSIKVEEILIKHPGIGMICTDCKNMKHREFAGYVKEVRLWPKVQAQELLGKHKKLFTDKVEHSVAGTLEELLAASHKPEEKE